MGANADLAATLIVAKQKEIEKARSKNDLILVMKLEKELDKLEAKWLKHKEAGT